MRERRHLAAAFVVTATVAGCASSSPAPAPTPTTYGPASNPPPIDVTDNGTPDPTADPESPEPKPPAEPLGEGRIVRNSDGTCEWTASGDGIADPPRKAVPCPPILTTTLTDDAHMDSVNTTATGACFVTIYYSTKCPPTARCNPPPPRKEPVACYPGDEPAKD